MAPNLFHPGILQETAIVQPNIIDNVYAENRAQNTIHLFSGPDFGSTGHPTTRSCLNCLCALLAHYSPDNVLDAGTGNAILAIAAAFLGVEKIIAVDILPEVLNTARQNVILNNVQKKVCLCCADAFLMRGRYNLIIANLNPGCFEQLDSFLEVRLIKDGYSIVSGLSGFERDRIFSRLVTNGPFIVHDALWDSGWTTFLFQKTCGSSSTK